MTFFIFFPILSAMIRFSAVKDLFKNLQTTEEKYQKIIELGRELPPMDHFFKIPENVVKGCQSTVYLHCEFLEGKIYFYAASDALISAGLAALLIKAYSGCAPEEVLQIKPAFLEELDIYSSLSPGRSNGLASMYLRMQQHALKYLLERKNTSS